MSVIDLIIRIKNGYMAKREEVTSPYSKFRVSVLDKLKKLNYIEDYSVEGEAKKEIRVKLRYEEGIPAFTDVKIYSTPGRRWYVQYKELKPVLGGLGNGIISSSKGIMTDSEARKERIGGELLFDVW